MAMRDLPGGGAGLKKSARRQSVVKDCHKNSRGCQTDRARPTPVLRNQPPNSKEGGNRNSGDRGYHKPIAESYSHCGKRFPGDGNGRSVEDRQDVCIGQHLNSSGWIDDSRVVAFGAEVQDPVREL